MFIIKENMTPEEFLQFVEQHPDKRFDFVDNEVVEVASKRIHSWLQGYIGHLLHLYLADHPIGRVYTEILHNLNDYNFVPDIAVQPKRPQDKDYFTEPPLLVIEIRSDTQTKAAQRRKAQAYIERDVPMVWLILPGEQVEVYVKDSEEPTIYTKGDTITGGDVLPGFEVAAIELLEEPE